MLKMKHLLSSMAIFFCFILLFPLNGHTQNYPQKTNLPTIYINTFGNKPITSKVQYIYATLNYVDETGVTRYDSMEIRGRGNSTWNLAKKPYRIKFNKKQRFMGKEKANAKSWTLLANYGDKALIRNAVAACIGEIGRAHV